MSKKRSGTDLFPGLGRPKRRTPANPTDFVHLIDIFFTMSLSGSVDLMNNVATEANTEVVDDAAKCPTEELYNKMDRSFPSLVLLCIGLKNEEGKAVLNLEEDP
jgi:hypothetical protein